MLTLIAKKDKTEKKAFARVLNFIAKKDKTEKKAFGARVSGGTLLLPQDVTNRLEQLSIHTAEDFVSYLHAFPSDVAATLEWDLEDVLEARAALVSKLRGLVDERILEPKSPTPRSYGARVPGLRKVHGE